MGTDTLWKTFLRLWKGGNNGQEDLGSIMESYLEALVPNDRLLDAYAKLWKPKKLAQYKKDGTMVKVELSDHDKVTESWGAEIMTGYDQGRLVKIPTKDLLSPRCPGCKYCYAPGGCPECKAGTPCKYKDAEDAARLMVAGSVGLSLMPDFGKANVHIITPQIWEYYIYGKGWVKISGESLNELREAFPDGKNSKSYKQFHEDGLRMSLRINREIEGTLYATDKPGLNPNDGAEFRTGFHLVKEGSVNYLWSGLVRARLPVPQYYDGRWNDMSDDLLKAVQTRFPKGKYSVGYLPGQSIQLSRTSGESFTLCTGDRPVKLTPKQNTKVWDVGDIAIYTSPHDTVTWEA